MIETDFRQLQIAVVSCTFGFCDEMIFYDPDCLISYIEFQYPSKVALKLKLTDIKPYTVQYITHEGLLDIYPVY